MSQKNYVSQKPRLLKNFDKSISRIRPVLISHYGEEQVNTLIRDSHQEYETLIPQIPYIGEKSPFLVLLLPTIRCLAIYRALQNQGKTVEDAGQIIFEMSEAELKSIPRLVRRLLSFFWFSPWFSKRLKKRAKESQEREYPGNFVMNYIEGDGQKYDYGIDYIECANVKFLQVQGALELAPYICATDKMVSEMLGWGLSRSMTIAEGCEKCDFRFKKGGQTFVQVPQSSKQVKQNI